MNIFSQMGVHDFLVFFVFIWSLGFKARVLYSQDTVICDSGDLNALKLFMNGLETVIEGWNVSSNCCDWPGVACNSSSSLGLSDTSNSGRVVELLLVNKKLSGNLSDSLGDLDQLQVLNLSHNSLKDNLPVSLLNLSKLEVLDLSSNELSGTIPENIFLPSLDHLDISQNRFNGVLPVSVCVNSPQVRVLNLADNDFSGNISYGFGNCAHLQNLSLGVNKLTGGISEDILQLRELVQLSLQDNLLSGGLTSGISDLSELVRLDISMNAFSGNIPDVFQKMKNLKYFIASSNNFTGQIPSSLSNSPSLVFLSLRNNSLIGPININCSAMTSLVSLDLGTNSFTGNLPTSLADCQRLTNVNFGKNINISGQIPESFKNMQALTYLSLSNISLSNISSGLAILQQCKNLTILVLTLNFKDEYLPADPSLDFEKLKVLVIANCGLQGTMPQWLSRSTNLQLLDLSWNKLNGSIPSWIGNFQSLFYLDMSNNSFSGEMPKEITQLPSWINRTIKLEDPSPDFPFFLKKNVSAGGLRYNQVQSFPPTLELSLNNLSGTIWPEFGNLKKLHVLDLGNNFLSGQIPDSLSGMESLETLNLAYNNLSGCIPSSLTSLTFLSTFSVAHNTDMYGEIPAGQFLTFPNSSFEGTQVCGDHRPLLCQKEKNTTISTNGSSRSRKTVIGMAVGIVFGTIFLLALMAVIVMRTHSRGEVDPETEERSIRNKDLEGLESKLLVLFHNKESDGKLSFDDISKATNDFDQGNIIGCGGFGMVYKACLPDGRKLAIKKLSGDGGQVEREFQAEVETLSKAQHPNLVHLLGFCMDEDSRLLIYSFMENSSLDYWLHEKPDGAALLDWYKRLQIAQGAARGLAYLHESCVPHIVHRDIKSSNILLDENFEAHLADFGLARLICAYDTHVTTDLVGTLGYIPPEYGQASVATYKGDIYSFGVVLLELLTGKRPMDMCKPRGSRDLISWVIQMKKEKREGEVFDVHIYGKHHDNQILKVFDIACLCLSDNPKARPSTHQLVTWLGSIDVDFTH